MRGWLRALTAVVAAVGAAALGEAGPARAADGVSSGPIANLSPEHAIEVPPVPQPGEAANTIQASGGLRSSVGEFVRAPKTETQSLGVPSAHHAGAAKQAQPKTSQAGASWTDHWIVRGFGATALLGGVLLLVRWGARKAAGAGGVAAQLGAGGRAPAGVLSVLGRYPVSRGHSLVLLKLDRRVLLLGQSPAGFTTLSELNDPDDVASVLAKTADADGTGLTRRFNDMLRGLERDPKLVESESGGAGHDGPVTPRLAMRTMGRGAIGGAA